MNRRTRTWKKLSSKKIYKNSWISLREDRVIRPDGKKGIYSIIETRGPCVYIVALTPLNEVYFVRQHRYPTGITSWELPGGNSDGQNVLRAARRELKEETGMTASRWTRIGGFQTAPGMTNELGHVFLARGLRQGRAVNAHAEGITAINAVPLDRALTMVMKGDISDGQSILGLLTAALWLAKHSRRAPRKSFHHRRRRGSMKDVYVCTGGCGGKVSAEEYAAGKTTCGTPGCAKHGQPFEKRQECKQCHAVVNPGETHQH